MRVEIKIFRKYLFKIVKPILGLPRLTKRTIAIFVDVNLCVFAVWLAFYLRLGEFVIISNEIFWASIVSIALAIPIFMALGLYRAIFRYSGLSAMIALAQAVGIYSLLYFTIFTVIGISGVPRTIGIIQPILVLLLVGASRTFARLWLGNDYQSILIKMARPNVLVYGAGNAGRQLVDTLANSNEMQVKGFLDDDKNLHDQILNGKPIYNPAELLNIVNTYSIKQIFLAMPNLKRKRRNEILAELQKTHVSIRTLPSLAELARGKISNSDIYELDINDLLRREPVIPNDMLLKLNTSNKIVMVTGAGGSIGGELCRQILACRPIKLILIEQNEFALYKIQQELENQNKSSEVQLISLLASVQDEDRIRKIISTWMPNTIYHAAAYKHVPIVEQNQIEGIKNNIFGTLRTAKIALENDVSNFVLISTDKAVRPTNLMGASKRLAEMVLQALATIKSATKFSIVRFGNVLDSSGSVVPKFRQQIRDGGPITLTHPDVTRYFMTIPEASQLVIQAGAMAKGGDVFILNMGEPVRVIDLARQMIKLSGKTIKDECNKDGDIEIQITGLRTGEKLYEELLIGNDPQPTHHPLIMKANEEYVAWEEIEQKLSELEKLIKEDDILKIQLIIKDLVKNYTISEEIIDWIYQNRKLSI